MRFPRRALIAALAALACAALHLFGAPAPAAASTRQVAIIEDDIHMLGDPLATLRTFRSLGAGIVRVFVNWAAIAPDWTSTREPAGFDASDPAAYPAGAWDRYDAIVRDAKREGLAIDFVVTGGSPRWADGPGIPSQAATNPNRAWYPSAAKYGAFFHAVATRYTGDYPDPEDPGHTLPRISFWSIWNEPNFGEDLGPQAVDGSTMFVAPAMYRSLVNAGWNALQATGHGHDTILIGELAARGLVGKPDAAHPGGLPGDFSQTKPLPFLRMLYCVDPNYHELRGSAAKALGCPTTAAGSQAFRRQNPALFGATGVGDHPYPGDEPPTKDTSRDPSFATLPKLPNLEAELDRLERIYGSHRRLPIYSDEFGYITHPPNRDRFVSPATAAYYLNWAEYLTWRNARVASTGQYLLFDPVPTKLAPGGGFASGLLTWRGERKPAYAAYRVPIYLPRTSARRGRTLLVWGCVRPAHYAGLDTSDPQYVRIQLRRRHRGPFTTVRQIRITNPRGYFEARVRFPASGTVRLSWSYPANDPLLPNGTIYSRLQAITVR
jgi:hypothetical protein